MEEQGQRKMPAANTFQEKNDLAGELRYSDMQLHVKFCHKSLGAQLIMYWEKLFRNAVINAVIRWRRQVEDDPPFTRLVIFGNNTKRTDMEIIKGGTVKRTRHSATRNLSN